MRPVPLLRVMVCPTCAAAAQARGWKDSPFHCLGLKARQTPPTTPGKEERHRGGGKAVQGARELRGRGWEGRRHPTGVRVIALTTAPSLA